MGLFSRSRRDPGSSDPRGVPSARAARDETLAHFRTFVESRPGCEAFIEPATRVTQTTMVIVAETGEWTRRKVPDAATASKVAKELGIQAYDVNLSGYPSRMREWSEKQSKGSG